MSVVTLTINGQLVSARADDTILLAAREAGIAIPTLCYVEGLSAHGGCRMCLVEIAGSPRLQPACFMKVSEDMVVQTDTDRLREYRRMIVEMLLAERKSHLLGVRLQRALRASGFGDFSRRDQRPLPVPISADAGGPLPGAVRARSQPLHPVLALRACLPGSGRRACLGHHGPRHPFAAGQRARSAVVGRGKLYSLRQVCTSLSDRRHG